jgi:hypothetical protein
MGRECSTPDRIECWFESEKARDEYEDLDVDGIIILKLILER